MIVRLTLCLLLINAAIGKVEDVKVNVLQSDGTVIQSLTAGSDKQPLQLPVIDHTQQLQVIVNAEQVFTSTFAEKLHIPFDVQVLFTLGTSNSRPEQVVLRLVNQRSPDTAAYFTISASNGEYSISIKPDAVQRQTGAGKGVWHAAVLLGSSTASTLTTIPIGSVEFKYSPLDDGSQPPEGIRAIDTVSTPKIDMPYVFRPDQKQISAIISVPFAALAVVPTLALFRLLSQQTQVRRRHNFTCFQNFTSN